MIFWRFGGKGWLTDWLTESITKVFVEQPRLHRVCETWLVGHYFRFLTLWLRWEATPMTWAGWNLMYLHWAIYRWLSIYIYIWEVSQRAENDPYWIKDILFCCEASKFTVLVNTFFNMVCMLLNTKVRTSSFQFTKFTCKIWLKQPLNLAFKYFFFYLVCPKVQFQLVWK